MLTIAIIDKHLIIRTGIENLLLKKYRNINFISAEDMDQLKNSTGYVEPDLILIGTDQDVDTNIQNIMSVKRLFRSNCIIIYDSAPVPVNVLQYFKVGASGYLSIGDNINELVSCINQVRKGKRYIGIDAQEMILTENLSGTIMEPADEKRKLTTRELEIARYLRQGMNTTTIAKTLNRKNSTISTIKKNIFFKLKIDNIMKLEDAMKYIYN